MPPAAFLLVSMHDFRAIDGVILPLRNLGFLIGVSWLTVLVASAQNRYAYARAAMGSEFKLVFYASSDSIAKVASDSVFKRIEFLNGILSDYWDGSEANRLSATAATGEWFVASKELFEVLQKSQQLSQKTQGAFDITIGPSVQLWRRAIRRHYFPSQKDIRQARSSVGYRKLQLNPSKRGVLLKKRGMRIDFGGIGKGYAADEALTVLKYFGISQALLDAGGDLAIGDTPPHKNGWDIEVSSGQNDSTFRQILTLKNCGVATSGATYRYLQHGGVRYSHIVNPRTGIGLTTHTRTTVIAPDGTTADALATALSVLGVDKSKKVVRQFDNVKVWLIEQNGSQWRNF